MCACVILQEWVCWKRLLCVLLSSLQHCGSFKPHPLSCLDLTFRKLILATEQWEKLNQNSPTPQNTTSLPFPWYEIPLWLKKHGEPLSDTSENFKKDVCHFKDVILWSKCELLGTATWHKWLLDCSQYGRMTDSTIVGQVSGSPPFLHKMPQYGGGGSDAPPRRALSCHEPTQN